MPFLDIPKLWIKELPLEINEGGKKKNQLKDKTIPRLEKG